MAGCGDAGDGRNNGSGAGLKRKDVAISARRLCPSHAAAGDADTEMFSNHSDLPRRKHKHCQACPCFRIFVGLGLWSILDFMSHRNESFCSQRGLDLEYQNYSSSLGEAYL